MSPRAERKHSDSEITIATDSTCCSSSTDDSDTSSVASPNRRRVSFGEIRVRSYNRVLGDHHVEVGPPIGIGWEYVQKDPVDLVDYEESRVSPTRRKEELRLVSFERREILKQSGVKEKEIKAKVKMIKKQRELIRKEEEKERQRKEKEKQREGSKKQGKTVRTNDSEPLSTRVQSFRLRFGRSMSGPV